jgi:hypothetical protein
VAELVGVDRQDAVRGMWAAPPDPGALSVHEYDADGRRLTVANIFAANDPESTLMNVRSLAERRLIGRPLHLIINCRPDRVERNGQMGALVADVDPDSVIVIGAPTRSAASAVPERWQSRIVDLGGTRPASELLDAIVAGVPDAASLVMVGNIHGQGELLLAELEKLPEVRRDISGPTVRLPTVARQRRQLDDLSDTIVLKGLR